MDDIDQMGLDEGDYEDPILELLGAILGNISSRSGRLRELLMRGDGVPKWNGYICSTEYRPAMLQDMVVRPVSYEPCYLNPGMLLGIETIFDHLEENHGMINVPDDPDRCYRLHDMIHTMEGTRQWDPMYLSPSATWAATQSSGTHPRARRSASSQ